MRASLVASGIVAAIAAACPTAGAADRLAVPEDFATFQRDVSRLVTPQLDLPAKTFVQIDPVRQDSFHVYNPRPSNFARSWNMPRDQTSMLHAGLYYDQGTRSGDQPRVAGLSSSAPSLN